MEILNSLETSEEVDLLQQFKAKNPQFFRKDDRALLCHLLWVLGLLGLSDFFAVRTPFLILKILSGTISAFLWFCLINITIHHHQTHRNAASSPVMKKILDGIFLIVLPNASRRKIRYTRAHMNHHRRPFHETDVDHHYGIKQFLKMKGNFLSVSWYFLELTFIGAYMPGWEDDRYMNEVPLENWNQTDYRAVKEVDQKKAFQEAFLQWAGFFLMLGAAALYPGVRGALRAVAWGWAFPMLLVKNWAHFLGQFQHYQEEFLKEEVSICRKTKTYRIPGWINYLAGGEMSGHFLHHLYPEMPYYQVEAARQQFALDPELSRRFLLY